MKRFSIFKSNCAWKLKPILVVLMLSLLGIGNAWASSYYTGFKANGGATGIGYVYASTSNAATPVYETEVTAESQSADLGSSSATKQYYAWAKAVRGSKFNGWSISGDNGTVSPTSGTDSPITVTVTSAENKTNTGTATATWTTYTKVNVTYNPSEYGVYSVTYQYDSYNETTKEITTGDAENLSRTISSENGAQTIGSYNNDVITLKSTSGTFLGWYSDAGFTSLLSTANSYTYTAPTSGSAAVYPKYEQVDKYYGRLTASIAEVPYSMPGGGTIFVSKEEAGTGTYSDAAQTVDNVGMGTTGLKYYLHAQPTDKRYVFRGWYSNPECTGTALSTSADYTYTFTATSMNSASPTTGNVYAAFDFNLYYMQVEVEPAVPGLGMVLVKDNNTGTPDYTAYASHAEQFLYAYRLAPTANAYLYAKPKYGYKFSGWYDNPDCTGSAMSTANPYTYTATGTSTDPMNPSIINLYAKFVVDDAKVNITYIIPDQTKGEYTASVLDIAEVDDDFVWTFTKVYNSADYTANTTLSQNKTDVLRLEAQPKAGYGVTSWTIAGTAKTTPSHLYETTGTTTATYGVTFGDAKPFLVSAANATTGTQYATLAEALANLGSNKKITVVQNAYVPAGNYTIPSGVTLLVPHDETYAIKEGTTDLEKTYVKPSAYVTLTLGGGARLIVKGNISVSAKMASLGNNAQNGGVCGKYGAIIMETSGSQVSNITLNSGAHLYCWGYIYGDGRVEVLSGAEVYEGFVFVDWRGGSNTSDMAYNSQRVFPFNQYYIQNIEVPLTINKGAVEKVFSSVYASSQHNSLSISMIGESSGLFRLTGTGSKLTKWYDPMNDRQHFELEGAASISDISFKVYGINVSSTDYVLPINNNMDIVIKEGASVNITEDVCVMPDATITIEKNATMAIADGANVYVYDKRAYTNAGTYPTSRGGYPSAGAGCYAQAAYIRLIGYSPSWAAIESVRVKRALKTMKSAQFNINGTLAVAGKLYTTEGGADLRSDADGAKITFSSATGTATITYQVDHSGYNEYYYSIPITPAKLHNGDGSYVVTIGSVSEDKFFYSKSQEKWLKNPKVVSWNANGGTTEASTMAYSEGAFVGELPAAYKDGYTLEGWYTAADGGTQIDAATKVTANITYYAHWTPKTYHIAYMDQGKAAFSSTHIDTPNPHPTTYTAGTATTLNDANNKTGYDFGGWHTISNCKESSKVTVLAADGYSKDITLYAKWIPQTYTITYKDQNDVAFSGEHGVGYPTEHTYGTATTLINPSKIGYTFGSWYTASDCTSGQVTSLVADGYTADITLYAKWEPRTDISYTVKHYKQNIENDEYTEVTADQESKQGTTATATAATAKSYTGFTAQPVTQGTIAGDGSTVVSIYYNRITYTVTWDWNESGTPTTYSDDVKYGAAPVYAYATPTKHSDATYNYTFTGWSDGTNTYAVGAALPAVTAAITYTAQYAQVNLDLVVDDEYELPGTTAVTNVTVTTDGILTIDETEVLTATNLILQATTSTSGQIIADETNLNVINAYFDLTLNAETRTWYGVGVPWRVNAQYGIYGGADSEHLTLLRLGKDFDIVWYDGEIRAASGPVSMCYKYLEDIGDPNNRIVEPGRMYFMFFARPYNVIRFKKLTGAALVNDEVSVPMERYTGAADQTNHGWNGIANPGLTYVTIPNAAPNAGYRYNSVNIDNKSLTQWVPVLNLQAETFVVGQPIMVQLPQTGGINLGMVRTAASSAPLRKMAANGDIDRAEVVMTSSTGLTDRILCAVDDEARDEYTIGSDLVKFTNSEELPQLWINNYKHALAINTVRLENSVATYPLTVVSPKAGDYTLSLANKMADGIHVYLTLNGEAIADLTEGEYVLTLGKETSKAYGIRLVRGPRGTVTAIDEALEGKENVEKVVKDGVLYIIRQGNVYDASGRKVE